MNNIMTPFELWLRTGLVFVSLWLLGVWIAKTVDKDEGIIVQFLAGAVGIIIFIFYATMLITYLKLL